VSRGSGLVASAGLVLLVALVYAGTLRNGFALDAVELVESNALVADLGNVPLLLRSDYWAPHAHSGLYRPLATLSFAAVRSLLGPGAAGQHAVDVALHALVALLALALYRRLAPSRSVATAGAFLFAAHAVHSEVVANVAGRADLLGSAFFLGALLVHVELGRAEAGGRCRRVAAGALLYALALLSKESAVALVAAMLLHDLAYASAGEGSRLDRARRAVGARLPSYAAVLVVSLAYVALRVGVLERAWPGAAASAVDNPLAALAPHARAAGALVAALHAVAIWLLPLRLSYDYSYDAIPLVTSAADPRLWLALALVGAGAWLLRASLRREPALFFGLGFALVTGFVVSNLVVPIGTVFGERLLYLPSVGLCLAAAAALRRIVDALPGSRSRRTWVYASVMALLVALHGARGAVRSRDWQSDARLFLHDLGSRPRSAKIQSNAGAVLIGQDRADEALRHLDAALAIAPGYRPARLHRAHALARVGREAEAIALYEALLDEGVGEPVLYNNLGSLLLDRPGHRARAVALIERAVESDPDDPALLDSLARARLRGGRLAEARDALQRSLALDPASAPDDDRRERLRAIEEALSRP
jgi:tetratricopeptide (TPR) repeat protein